MIFHNFIRQGFYAFFFFLALISVSLAAPFDSSDITFYRDGFWDEQQIYRLKRDGFEGIDSSEVIAHISPVLVEQKFPLRDISIAFNSASRPTFFINPLYVTKFNEIWVDYFSNHDHGGCNPNIAIGGLADSSLSKAPALTRVNFPDVPPKKKGFMYQISRMFDYPYDGIFHYSKTLDSSVYQVRSNLIIANREAIVSSLNIYTNKDVVRVNLVLLYDGKKRLLEFPYPLKERGGEGAYFNLNLLSGLKSLDYKFILENKVVSIKEIVIFTSDNDPLLSDERPVNFLLLKSDDREHVAREKFLNLLDIHALGNKISRAKFLFDSNKVEALNKTGGEMNFGFSNNKGYLSQTCGNIASIRLVDNNGILAPKFVAELRGWVQSVGGPFIANIDRPDYFEIPKLLSWVSLGGFSDNSATGSENGMDERVRNFISRFSQGVKVAVEGRNITLPNSSGGLEITGDSLKIIKITWPLISPLTESKNLYFVLRGLIWNKGLDHFSLKISFDRGAPIYYEITPNSAIQLPDSLRKILSAEIVVKPSSDSHHLKIDGGGFFIPTMESVRGGFQKGVVPDQVVLEPKPSALAEGINFEPRRGAAVFPSNTRYLEFSTPINNKLIWFSGIEIRFSNDYALKNQSSELYLSAKWEGGTVLKKITLAGKDQKIWIPAYEFADSERKLGALNGFEWRLANTNASASASLNKAKISWKIYGVSQNTFSTNLRHSNLDLGDDFKVGFNSSQFNNVNSGLVLPLEIQPSKFIQRLSETHALTPIALSDPMFFLTQLSLYSSQGNVSSLFNYKTRIGNPPEVTFSNLLYLIIFITLIVVSIFYIKLHFNFVLKMLKIIGYKYILFVDILNSRLLDLLNVRMIKLSFGLLILILFAFAFVFNISALLGIFALLVTFLANKLMLMLKVFLTKKNYFLFHLIYENVSGTYFFVSIIFIAAMIFALLCDLKLFAAFFSLVIFYSLLVGAYYSVINLDS